MSDIHPNVVRVMEAARERGLEITTLIGLTLGTSLKSTCVAMTRAGR